MFIESVDNGGACGFTVGYPQGARRADGTKRYAATSPQWTAAGAGPGATSPLLAPRLLATTPNFATALGGSSLALLVSQRHMQSLADCYFRDFHLRKFRGGGRFSARTGE